MSLPAAPTLDGEEVKMRALGRAFVLVLAIAFLAVTFEPAMAREPGGAPTFDTSTITTDYPRLREVRFAGDFEGRVSFGVGVGDARRGGFRVTELIGPNRVAVDVRG